MIVALIILGAVVYVATGRGGELSVEQPDYAPLDLGLLSATDVVLHRPPTNAWGYSVQATDEALTRIAESIRERDVRIVALEQLVTDLSHDPAPARPAGGYVGHRRRAESIQDAEATRAEDFPHTFERPLAQPAQPTEAHEDEPEEDLPHPVQWTRAEHPVQWTRAENPEPDPAQPYATQPGPAQPDTERPQDTASTDTADTADTTEADADADADAAEADTAEAGAAETPQPQTPLELPWEPARAKPAPPAQPGQGQSQQQRPQQEGPPERSHD